ncbi:MAG: hypothetical protein JWM32_880 [Verrucomicrobia bacterium]|nr:hypothetical protein [Verrucomicrobiota bacterium]
MKQPMISRNNKINVVQDAATPQPLAAGDQGKIARQLDALRAELVELAFALDRRGSAEAADVAITTSAKVEELRAELCCEPSP